MISIIKYQEKYKLCWDSFIDNSKNGTFMLKRDYMEYHSVRYIDYSLLVYIGDSLRSIIPGSLNNNQVISHGGLTYGGFIIDKQMTAQTMLDIFDAVIAFLKDQNIKSLIYKRIPSIYYSYPSDEDLYALFRVGAELYRRDISSTILLPSKIEFSKDKKRHIKKACSTGLSFSESKDYCSFVEILKTVLSRHDVSPVHTSNELRYLAETFPDNIKLYAAFKDSTMIAGVVVFINKDVVHTQYMANSDEGRKIGALDFILDKLINCIFCNFKYFDFGISTENDGLILNDGLIMQKQGFGGRATIHDFYRIKIC